MLTVAGDGLGVSASEIADALTSRRIGRKAPKPARFSVSQGVPVIVDGTLGAKVDGTATAEAARKALAAGDKRFEIRLRDVEPDITKSDLAGLGIRKELASFTTRFDPDVDGRDENIALAAGAVRGKVLGEGEVFSLNKTTGPRGRTSGYKEALVFMKGKVVPGVGGGVCQVSSTLYNGALLAGLKIVERHSHSMAVSYVIPGRDATAYYPTIDLKFQNTTGSPIMIWTEVGDGTLTVKVFGSTKRPDVQIITDVRKTIRQGKHVVHDRTIPHNEYRVDSAGIPGYVVSSFRIFRENGRVLKREPLATDEYRPREAVIRVGI